MVDHTLARSARERFDAEHGPEYVIDGDWVLFADGARRENAALSCTVLPSPDPHERARWVLRYHEVKWRKAVKAFEDRKEFYLRHPLANPGPAEVEAAARDLRALKTAANEALTELEKARELPKKNKPAWQVEQDERRAAERKAKQEFKAAIADIEL